MRAFGTFIIWVILIVGVHSSAQSTSSAAESGGLTQIAETSDGMIRVTPKTGISGEFGTWTVTFTVGQQGIHQGGAIRVELPDAWHAGTRVSANRLQASDPSDEHYVSARSSRGDIKLQTIVEEETERRLVKHVKRSIDGRKGRHVFVVRVQLVEGELRNGDTIDVIYGDRSGGSPGYRASAISSGPQPVLVAVDNEGTGHFRLHTQRSATLVSLSGAPVEVLLHLPSDGVVGQPVTATVAILDKQSNPASVAATVELAVVSGRAAAPASIRLPQGKGYVQFELVPKETGIIRMQAEIRELGLHSAGNALRVQRAPPKLRVYWGDLHSHSEYSFDAVGNKPFEYARYISGLDFYALTDHSWPPDADGTTTGLSESTWKTYGVATDDNYVFGSFVTLHAYECSMDGPYGHHNVYFRDKQGPLHYAQSHILPEAHTSTLPDIWASLEAGDALTIPHHTGKFPPGIVFSPQNDEFRRNFEIYSGHGLSERFDPGHSLAFEKSDFTSDSESVDSPSYAQDAWKLGLRLSTIAATDDHYSHPGKPHWGATAVLAEELTRDGVFRALHGRRTYATTGSRIILDFTLNGAPMGSIVVARSPPRIRIGVIGTDAIARIELLRYVPGDGDFVVYRQWQPQALDFEQEFVDREWRAGAMYYVRVTQVNQVRGRPVMAWSSPIWTAEQD